MMKSNARHLVPALLLEGESQETPNRENRDLGAELRMEFEFRKHRFIKRYTLAAIFIAALIVWTVVSCSITAAIVRKNTTKEVTQRVEAEMRNSFQTYLDQKEEDKKKENFLTGTESFDAAVDVLVGPMSQILSCYAQEYGITTEGLYTIGWSFCARCAQNSPGRRNSQRGCNRLSQRKVAGRLHNGNDLLQQRGWRQNHCKK